MKPRVGVHTTRLRIEAIQARTETTTIPKIEDVFSRFDNVDGEMTRSISTLMTYSDYPHIKVDGAVAMNAFLMNSLNVKELKQSGSLGAIVESLRQVAACKDFKSDHVGNLIRSLHAITKNDTSMQQRLLSHPFGISEILKLCKACSGQYQFVLFEILDGLAKLPNGVTKLLDNGIFTHLLTEELLYRNSTLLTVRHAACHLANRITIISPSNFPIDMIENLTLDGGHIRRIDGYMEMQLLNAILCHLIYLETHKTALCGVLTIVKHFILEITNETFENLDHLQQIIRCCVILSKDQTQAAFMMAHSLAVAMQFLVRTDFGLYRRKQTQSFDTSSKGDKFKSLPNIKAVPTKKLSVQDSGDRPQGTMMALAVIRPEMKQSRNEDINFFTTRSVVTIYENIIMHDVSIVSDIISSGLIPALLFRVGQGTDKDTRFNKLVIHFLYIILTKVMLVQPQAVRHMTTISLTATATPQRVSYLRAGGCSSANNQAMQAAMVASGHKVKVSATDLRGISNTLHAQHATHLFFSSMQSVEDPVLVTEAVTCISIATFNVIADLVYDVENTSRICHLCLTRIDCFFPALNVVCEMINYIDVTDESLNFLMQHVKVMKILCRAIKLSGWVFHMKGKVYKSLGRLSQLPHFREKLIESEGLSVLLWEITVRRQALQTQGMRARAELEEDNTDTLLQVLRRDLCVLKIQTRVRAMAARLKARLRKQALLTGSAAATAVKTNVIADTNKRRP